MRKNSVNIILSALFTAIIALLSQVSFMLLPVPLTFQTLGIALCGFVLGVKWSITSVGVYLAVGALGLPVFSGFRGGIHILFGPTGGFLFGFIILALFCGFAKKCKKTYIKYVYMLVGIIICHAIGIFQYSLITGNNIAVSFISFSLPFIIKDVFCIFGAYFLSIYVLRLSKFKI